jgi:hypothetical protein
MVGAIFIECASRLVALHWRAKRSLRRLRARQNLKRQLERQERVHAGRGLKNAVLWFADVA